MGSISVLKPHIKRTVFLGACFFFFNGWLNLILHVFKNTAHTLFLVNHLSQSHQSPHLLYQNWTAGQFRHQTRRVPSPHYRSQSRCRVAVQQWCWLLRKLGQRWCHFRGSFAKQLLFCSIPVQYIPTWRRYVLHVPLRGVRTPTALNAEYSAHWAYRSEVIAASVLSAHIKRTGSNGAPSIFEKIEGF